MRRLINITLTTMVVTAGITSAAAAQNYNDLRSPDARDSARHVSTVTDLRSPDARDAARHTWLVTDLGSPARGAVPHTSALTYLRSPDARDSARTPAVSYQPGRVPIVQPQQPVLQVSSSAINWGDVGIGAAGMLALIAIVAGALTIVSHRRRGPVATS
jgi:hypothetical protein